MQISGDSLKIIGHRGWPARFPDNVLAGLKAVATVADMVEVDVRRTADGVLVLSHDPVLGGKQVSSTAWPVLRALDLGDGHRPVALAEALAALPNFPFNLEIKNLPGEPGFEPDNEIARDTAAVARSGDLLTSFHWPTVDAVRPTYPQVATGLLVDSGGSLTDAVGHALAQGHLAVVAHWQLARADSAAVAAAVEGGLTVAVWTLNDPGVARELAGLGVSAIITDDPGAMRRALR